MRKPLQKDIVITGEWNGERIWREMTPEEKMKRDTGINTDTLAFSLLTLGSRHLSKLKKI